VKTDTSLHALTCYDDVSIKLLYTEICGKQCNATVPSDSLGQVDFSVVLVEFVHHIPEWQVILCKLKNNRCTVRDKPVGDW